MNRITLYLGNLAFFRGIHDKGGWKILEGGFPLCWAQMVACSHGETGQEEEVGSALCMPVEAWPGFGRLVYLLG